MCLSQKVGSETCDSKGPGLFSLLVSLFSCCERLLVRKTKNANFPGSFFCFFVVRNIQVECMCIPKGVKGSSLTSSFRAGGDLAMTTDLGETLVGLTRVIPHGMLFFFPSFQKLETTLSRWMESGLWNRIEEHKEIFSEPRHARSLDKVIRGYEERVDHSVKGESRGAILFAVFRGKISEGIDFSDAKARGE
mmetsp:Transcript_5972/g.14362  ORF Transcript_5972/g.14362 Transcript_5972/m.14362 type:complete len:192 (+) Transcript_5972:3017-3592(+)